MTNYEKYKNLVIDCVLKYSPCELVDKAYGLGSCNERTCTECRKIIEEWLNKEYIGIDWSKVKVDTPVTIKDEKGIMFRHFAKYYREHVYVYANGKTSWTNDGETEAWEPECVKLGRDEDNKKYARQ